MRVNVSLRKEVMKIFANTFISPTSKLSISEERVNNFFLSVKSKQNIAFVLCRSRRLYHLFTSSSFIEI